MAEIAGAVETELGQSSVEPRPAGVDRSAKREQGGGHRQAACLASHRIGDGCGEFAMAPAAGTVVVRLQRQVRGRSRPREEEEQVGKVVRMRSEEHTSELQSLMRISYAVFCLKKKK